MTKTGLMSKSSDFEIFWILWWIFAVWRHKVLILCQNVVILPKTIFYYTMLQYSVKSWCFFVILQHKCLIEICETQFSKILDFYNKKFAPFNTKWQSHEILDFKTKSFNDTKFTFLQLKLIILCQRSCDFSKINVLM